MCDFNNLDEETKQSYHELLTKCAQAFGGINYFLQLIEELRKTKPHPLTAKGCAFHFPLGVVRWDKVIFNDKVLLLAKVKDDALKDGNILHEKGTRAYKNAFNLIRTLSPVTFKATPKEGEGFEVKAFDTIDENTVKLNPVFEALFFAPIWATKNVLNYKAK